MPLGLPCLPKFGSYTFTFLVLLALASACAFSLSLLCYLICGWRFYAGLFFSVVIRCSRLYPCPDCFGSRGFLQVFPGVCTPPSVWIFLYSFRLYCRLCLLYCPPPLALERSDFAKKGRAAFPVFFWLFVLIALTFGLLNNKAGWLNSQKLPTRYKKIQHGKFNVFARIWANFPFRLCRLLP